MPRPAPTPRRASPFFPIIRPSLYATSREPARVGSFCGLFLQHHRERRAVKIKINTRRQHGHMCEGDSMHVRVSHDLRASQTSSSPCIVSPSFHPSHLYSLEPGGCPGRRHGTLRATSDTPKEDCVQSRGDTSTDHTSGMPCPLFLGCPAHIPSVASSPVGFWVREPVPHMRGAVRGNPLPHLLEPSGDCGSPASRLRCTSEATADADLR